METGCRINRPKSGLTSRRSPRGESEFARADIRRLDVTPLLHRAGSFSLAWASLPHLLIHPSVNQGLRDRRGNRDKIRACLSARINRTYRRGCRNRYAEPREVPPMTGKWSKRSVIIATLTLLIACATELRAQISNYLPSAPSQAAQALTGSQQSAANSALCSAVASQVPNPTAADPSVLSSPSVISTAATTFAGSTSLPLASATTCCKAMSRRMPPTSSRRAR